MLPPKKFEIFYNSNNDSVEYKKPLNTTGKDIIDLQNYLVKISKKSSLIPKGIIALFKFFALSGNFFKSFSQPGANVKKPDGVYTTKR